MQDLLWSQDHSQCTLCTKALGIIADRGGAEVYWREVI